MSKDYHALFDLVTGKFLGIAPVIDGRPSYFQNDFDCCALLFAICVKEHDTGASEYSADERETLQQFIEALPANKQISEKPLVIRCLEFFEPKL